MQDFRTTCIEKSTIQPCPLCGEIHPLRIHSYPERCWRDPATGKNIRIRIITILCRKAEKMGKQFTERLLPDFLLPGRVIRADLTLKSLEEAREPLNLEKACSILGCIDIRTARSSLRYGYQVIKKACVFLEEKLAPFSGNLQAYHFTPDTPLLLSFRTLIDRYNQLQIHIHGGTGYALQCRCFSFLGFYWPQNKPTTYVSDPSPSPDTS